MSDREAVRSTTRREPRTVPKGSITKLLIANRGEIACRIIRTCREMNIATVAVHSEADREALHVARADAAYEIGPPPAAKSYLDIDAILHAAKISGADAVHPGYGFLAENADFARAVQGAGYQWIGPRPATIEAMGDKQRARCLAVAAKVPVLPGSARFERGEIGDPGEAAASIGFPLLVKPAAGGGGIGMGVVTSTSELSAQIETTQRLAERAFGDASIYLERYVGNARHVEVQVFGLGDGNGVHLFDRDCTIQRRFQKVIEEAPAPGLPDKVRTRLLESALALVREQRYLGAGTVEFIYDCDYQEAYFLEMNTRIQVEHAVTEMITGIDLVRWQLEVAAGTVHLPPQENINLGGHALECRIYAERPEKNFLPSPGLLTKLRFPSATDDLRIDTGVREGDRVTPFYDPMIAKMIASGPDRGGAIARMRDALEAVDIEGVSTNREFLLDVLDDPKFVNVAVTTRYVDSRVVSFAPRREAG